MYGEDKNSHTYSLTIQINVYLIDTVCLQENIIKYSFHLAESLHNFFTKESFL